MYFRIPRIETKPIGLPSFVIGICRTLFLGLAAGIVPAFGAYRSRITDALRTV